MSAYYNEIDQFAAAWLRELIKAGHIATGDVDERSIEDVVPSELMGYTQCHFFAGIGVWSHSLRQARWPDDKPIWTGSCPCQPFSAAGKGGGTSDERHLWPAFEWLIRQCRPGIVLGEQVESAIKHDWLDHVALQLEDLGYAVGAVGFPACSVGAPHIRQRLYWVAESKGRGRIPGGRNSSGGIGAGNRNSSEVQIRQERREDLQGKREDIRFISGDISPTRRVADAENIRRSRGLLRTAEGLSQSGTSQGSHPGVLGDSERQRHASGEDSDRGWQEDKQGRYSDIRNQSERPMPTNGFWADCEWVPCRDGKARAVEPGTFPLVNGAPARVGRLRGYGNAIVAPQTVEFIKAVMEDLYCV